jgi:hypothetical protein
MRYRIVVALLVSATVATTLSSCAPPDASCLFPADQVSAVVGADVTGVDYYANDAPRCRYRFAGAEVATVDVGWVPYSGEGILDEADLRGYGYVDLDADETTQLGTTGLKVTFPKDEFTTDSSSFVIFNHDGYAWTVDAIGQADLPRLDDLALKVAIAVVARDYPDASGSSASGGDDGDPVEPAAQCTPETAENAGFPKDAFATSETRSAAGLPIHWGGNPCWAIPAAGDDGQCAAWGYGDLVNAVTWNPILQNDSSTMANICHYYGWDGAMPSGWDRGSHGYPGTVTVVIRLATPQLDFNTCYLQWGWAPELYCDPSASMGVVELGPVSGVDGAVIYSMTSTVEAQAPTLVADLYAVIQVPGREAVAVVSLEYRPNTWASETQDQSDAVRMLEHLTAGIAERLEKMTGG